MNEAATVARTSAVEAAMPLAAAGAGTWWSKTAVEVRRRRQKSQQEEGREGKEGGTEGGQETGRV
jgi:hypothetical protein